MLAAAVQQLPRTLFLALVFVIVMLVAMTVMALIGNRAAVSRRLAEAAGTRAPAGGSLSLRQAEAQGAWARLTDSIERRGLTLADTNADTLRARLAAAGYESPAAPRVFTLIRIVTTLALPLLFVAATVTRGAAPSLMTLYIAGSLLALLGLYLPNLWISARAARRQREIVNGFPDALDLMLVCVEAGLGLEAAFDRVGREMTLTHPLIAALFGNVVLELRAGRSREDALRRLGDRAAVDQVRSFATLVIQSTKLGSSIAQTLRIYAAEMRERRKMLAQEKAHRLPVLLSIPLVVCMLPVMIGVLMLPAAIRVVRELIPAMAGG